MYLWCIDNVYVSCASHLCFPHNMYWRCIWLDYCSVLVMYLPCNTSQYIIEVLGCITGCIVMYSLMYWDHDVFDEVFWFMCRMGIHPNTADNTSQYIVEYIIIPLKYIPIHLWCIEMLIHPKYIWYIQNTSQYIPIHRVHPPRFANGRGICKVYTWYKHFHENSHYCQPGWYMPGIYFSSLIVKIQV